jgi:hypothetical protein
METGDSSSSLVEGGLDGRTLNWTALHRAFWPGSCTEYGDQVLHFLAASLAGHLLRCTGAWRSTAGICSSARPSNGTERAGRRDACLRTTTIIGGRARVVHSTVRGGSCLLQLAFHACMRGREIPSACTLHCLHAAPSSSFLQSGPAGWPVAACPLTLSDQWVWVRSGARIQCLRAGSPAAAAPAPVVQQRTPAPASPVTVLLLLPHHTEGGHCTLVMGRTRQLS